MLFKQFFIGLVILLLILSYCCEGQNEIRNAVRAKTNRKFNEGKQSIARGKQTIRRAKNRAKAPFKHVGTKIQKKYRNTRRKIQAIENVIQS